MCELETSKGETVLVDIVSVHGEWLIRDHLVGGEQPIPYMKWRITWDLPEIGPITNQLIWLPSIVLDCQALLSGMKKQVGA